MRGEVTDVEELRCALKAIDDAVQGLEQLALGDEQSSRAAGPATDEKLAQLDG